MYPDWFQGIHSFDIPERIRGPFRTAWKKGYLARMRGEPEEANPYSDRRGIRNAVTFSRGFWRAWLEGWRAADEEVKKRLASS